jgi:hypothetical protein
MTSNFQKVFFIGHCGLAGGKFNYLPVGNLVERRDRQGPA